MGAAYGVRHRKIMPALCEKSGPWRQAAH